MRPDFLIEGIESKKVTSICVIDESGIISDSVEICLDDSIIEIPATGSKLEVSLGYIETGLSYMGLYTINEITVHPQTIRIKGHAADFKGSFKSQKTEEWHQKTIGDLVSKIASKHGYEARVAPQFANILLPHIDQTAESDMHLLSRLAQLYGAISKPAGGFLLFVQEGKAKSYTEQEIGGDTIELKDVTNWQFTLSEREKKGTVIAYWHDLNKGEAMEEKAGEGEPVHTLRGIYATRELAKAAAHSKLERSVTQTLNMTLAGCAGLVAESKINLKGFRSNIPTSWVISRAEHILDERGYSTIIYAR